MTSEAVSADNDPLEHLRAVKASLLTALSAIDLAIATAGGRDLVTWAGRAEHEQRCGRCGFWIFMGNQIASVAVETDRSMYVHRRCLAGISNTEERRPVE